MAKALFILVLLLAPSAFSATEFGSYWTRPAAPPHPDVPWARGNLQHTTDALRRSVIVWPGATFLPPRHPHSRRQILLPENLRDVFLATAQHPALQAPNVGAIEIGNEPDLDFTAETPDRIAAVQKAATWAIRRHRPGIKVLMPSLAALPGPWCEQWLANRGAHYTDAWNVHFYGWSHDLLPNLELHRRHLIRSGLSHLPLWITEYGAADTPAQPAPIHLARQRASIERMTLEATLAQPAQLWLFSLTPYTEGDIDFGITHPDGSPRPAHHAWLRIISQLAGYTPRHRLVHTPSGETIGWVLESRDGSHWWSVLWTPWRRADSILPQSERPSSLTSIQPIQLRFSPRGRPLALGLDREHPVPDRLDWSFTLHAGTNLHLVTPPVPYAIDQVKWTRPNLRTSGRPHRNPSDRLKPSPVIASLVPSAPDRLENRLGYTFSPGFPLRLRASLHEFSGKARRGTWKLSVPPDWSGAASGKVQIDADQDLHLPITLLPSGSSDPTPRFITLNWFGEDGSRDISRIEVRPAGTPLASWIRLDGTWTSPEPDQVWERTGNGFELTTGSPTAAAQLVLPLPRDLRLGPDSFLRIEASLEGQSSRFRLELITPERAVFRHGDDSHVNPAVKVIHARIGDFTPAFWSRPHPVWPWDANSLRITLPQARPGTRLHLKVWSGQ